MKPKDSNGKPVFADEGLLNGPERISFRGSSQVQVIVAADSENIRNIWMNTVRNQISLWQLLHHRMKQVLLTSTLSENTLQSMFMSSKNCPQTDNMDNDPETPINTADFAEQGIAAVEGIYVLSGFIQAVATVAKKSAPLIQDTAQDVADVAKCITIGSSAFQVVAFCAKLADKGMEVKRGVNMWPRIREQVDER